MSARLKGRRRQVDRLLEVLVQWARSSPDVLGLALVGSYARGHERLSSDVDVIVLLAEVSAYPEQSGWFTHLATRARLVRRAAWGPVAEQRYRLGFGLLVEVGLAPTSWADLPLDAGTRRVLRDGHRILHDAHGLLARAAQAAAAPAAVLRPGAARGQPARAVVLVTGMSGTGTSSALEALAGRGHAVLDTDEPGWIVELDTPAGPEPGWDLERVGAALEGHREGWLFVAGCVANQGVLYDRFDAVVLLSAPVEVLLVRVADRPNPYGSTPDDRAKIAADNEAFEPMLRAGATHEIDTTAPLPDVVAALVRIAAAVEHG